MERLVWNKDIPKKDRWAWLLVLFSFAFSFFGWALISFYLLIDLIL